MIFLFAFGIAFVYLVWALMVDRGKPVCRVCGDTGEEWTGEYTFDGEWDGYCYPCSGCMRRTKAEEK